MEIAVADYVKFLETLPDPSLLVNCDGNIVYANALAISFFGYEAHELIDNPIERLVPEMMHDAHKKHVLDYHKSPVKRNMGSMFGLVSQHKHGQQIPSDIMLNPIELSDITYTVCIIRDISQLVETRKKLQHALARERVLARSDQLTGAANRRYFADALEGEIYRSSRHQRPFSVAYFDLDNFKQVNDQSGHKRGDEVLGLVVEITNYNLRRTDLLARLGGDEFAILLVEANEKTAELVISRVHHSLSAAIKSNNIPIGFSFGVITFLAPEHSPDKIIDMADQLMLSVKRDGKNKIKFVTETSQHSEDNS